MKSFSIVLVFAFVATGCTGNTEPFDNHPERYGLFVASTNLYFDNPLVIKREETGETIAIPMKKYVGSDSGYLVQALPPGRYDIYSYSPYVNVTIPLQTPDGFFDVQANCFDYGGHYHFELPANYQNALALKDIERLPSSIRKLAVNRDICISPVGKASQRLSGQDLKDLQL